MAEKKTIVDVPSLRPVSGSSRISRLSENSIRALSGLKRGDRDKTQLGEEDLLQLGAVFSIENWWIGIRNRQLFQILKDAVCTAEHSLTRDVAQKLCPREAELLKDPTMNAKVKFRFGGSTFPPVILFKVFIGMQGKGVKYMNGKKMIKSTTVAAEDARKMMGNRRYFDLLLTDACHHSQLKITDDMDVTTLKEYMQFTANLDETPAHLGGKQNLWRQLDLQVLPRHSHLHDIITTMVSLQRATSIPAEKLKALSRPPTQAEQLSLLRKISSSHMSSGGTSQAPPSRRSRQARQRADMMKRSYLESRQTHGRNVSCMGAT
jgi:hypothetical protein